jgi:hypothetical protein
MRLIHARFSVMNGFIALIHAWLAKMRPFIAMVVDVCALVLPVTVRFKVFAETRARSHLIGARS